MASFTILSLNNDCLYAIVSFIDDFSSFYNFSLTCKRLNQVTQNNREWHINVLKRKADFYVRDFIGYKDDDLIIIPLLSKAQHFAEDILSYSKVLRIWEKCGPVAAKLVSWIEQSSCPRYFEYSFWKKTLTFHLPSGQELRIDSMRYRDNVSISFYWGDLKDSYYQTVWGTKDNELIVKPFEPAIINILQKELGNTTHPITHKLFL